MCGNNENVQFNKKQEFFPTRNHSCLLEQIWKMALRLIITIAALRIIYVEGGIYTPDDSLPDGVITKYLKGKTEASCLLQCERDEQCDKTMFKMKNKQSRSGECWFVKKVSNGTKDEVKKLKQDISIRSFKKKIGRY